MNINKDIMCVVRQGMSQPWCLLYAWLHQTTFVTLACTEQLSIKLYHTSQHCTTLLNTAQHCTRLSKCHTICRSLFLDQKLYPPKNAQNFFELQATRTFFQSQTSSCPMPTYITKIYFHCWPIFTNSPKLDTNHILTF